MTIQTIKGTFLVKNDRGLHTRPSTEIVRLATTFKSDIRLRYQKIDVNAKSLLGVLMLAAVRGAKVKIIAQGKDAIEAVNALQALANCNFNIDY
ncbi:MAG: HPr family phosphocarrier protein [Parachlamydiaceae bacterium]|nr:HPr family phosphocarrier protein [Parachlamydiaceae bacterium]